MKLTGGVKVSIFVFVLLLIDQIVKVIVKTNMTIGESIPVFGTWFEILFVENKGMAFGMQFGGDIGKLILTLVRIGLVIFIIRYINKLLRKEDTPVGVIVGFVLIMCGALGNIVDSLFYGVLFEESTTTHVAQFLGPGGGYAPMFMGKVVDMFYFPIIDMVLPQWVPIWGGERFQFFQAIFNVADSYITCGGLYLILFKWRYFAKQQV